MIIKLDLVFEKMFIEIFLFDIFDDQSIKHPCSIDNSNLLNQRKIYNSYWLEFN